MLTKKELFLNHWAIYICCKSNFWPVDYDRRTGAIRPGKNKIRRFLWWYQVFLSGLYSLFKIFRLFQCSFYSEDEDYTLSRFCLHFNIATFSAVMALEGYYMLVRYPTETCYLINETFVHGVGRERTKRWTEYSLEEWILIFLPSSMSSCIWGLLLIFLRDPKAPQYLTPILPGGYRKEYWVVGLLAWWEYWNVFFWISVCYLCSFQLMSFVPRVCEEIDELPVPKSAIGSWTVSVDDLCQRLVGIKLKVDLFNVAYAQINYYVKLECLRLGIMGCFIAVRYMSQMPAIAAINTYAALLACSIFIITYGRAFRVPAKISETKQQLGLLCMRTTRWEYMKRKIRSIPDVPIKAGRFYSLERTSTPDFVDFVINQAVSLLLTF